MRLSRALRIGVALGATCLYGQGQSPAPVEAKGLPPRAAPADYQARLQVGKVTLAADFKGHSIPTPQGPLSTEDYVTVELGLFGAAGAPLKVTAGDFSLRVNGKKSPLPSQPFGLVISSTKDPEWIPPEPPASKSKGGLSTGGQDQQHAGEEAPRPAPIPLPVQRAMALRVQKAALPEGDRTLPQAGLLFFLYRGKADGIRSLELIYDGPAGKATMPLQP